MPWETVSLTIGLLTLWVSIVALGLPILSKLSACVTELAELRVQWTRCREADHAAHEVFEERLDDHEDRIETLEGEDEDWIGEDQGEDHENAKARNLNPEP